MPGQCAWFRGRGKHSNWQDASRRVDKPSLNRPRSHEPPDHEFRFVFADAASMTHQLAAAGNYGNTSEYDHLVRRDQEEQAKKLGFATSSRKGWRPGSAIVAPRRTRRNCHDRSRRDRQRGDLRPQALRDQGEVQLLPQRGCTSRCGEGGRRQTPRLTRSNSTLHRLTDAWKASLAFQGFDLAGRKFPLLWCYFERGDHLDVVRLLGERRDVAAILGDEFVSN